MWHTKILHVNLQLKEKNEKTKKWKKVCYHVSTFSNRHIILYPQGRKPCWPSYALNSTTPQLKPQNCCIRQNTHTHNTLRSVESKEAYLVFRPRKLYWRSHLRMTQTKHRLLTLQLDIGVQAELIEPIQTKFTRLHGNTGSTNMPAAFGVMTRLGPVTSLSYMTVVRTRLKHAQSFCDLADPLSRQSQLKCNCRQCSVGQLARGILTQQLHRHRVRQAPPLCTPHTQT